MTNTARLAPLISFPVDYDTVKSFLEAIRKEKEGELCKYCKKEDEPIEKSDGIEGDATSHDTIVPESLRQKTRDALDKIYDALERLDNGEFGICGTCGENIAPGRLRVTNLLAKNCIDCENEIERVAKQEQKTTRRFISDRHFHKRGNN